MGTQIFYEGMFFSRLKAEITESTGLKIISKKVASISMSPLFHFNINFSLQSAILNYFIRIHIQRFHDILSSSIQL